MATETITASSLGTPSSWTANSGTQVDAVATASDSLYITPDSAGAAIQFGMSNPSTVPSSNVTICYVRVTANLRKTTSDLSFVTVGISDGTTYRAGDRLEVASTTSTAYTWDFDEKAATGIFTLSDVNALQVRLTGSVTTIECDLLTASVVFITSNGMEFRWEAGTSWDDDQAGAYCSMTGMWAPGHSLVGVGGRQYIAEYAPMDEVEQIERVRPRTGKSF